MYLSSHLFLISSHSFFEPASRGGDLEWFPSTGAPCPEFICGIYV